MKKNFVIELYLNQLYLPIILKVTEAYWSHILFCWDLFVRISTKALCSSLIAFIITSGLDLFLETSYIWPTVDEQKKKK